MKSAIMSLGLLGALALTLAFGCGGSTSGDSTAGSGGAGTGGITGGSGGTSTGGSGGTSTGGSGGTSTGGIGGNGGTVNYAACSTPGTCLLFPKNCCGYCGQYVPITEYVPVEKSNYEKVQAELCEEPQACPDCVGFDDPNYLSLCRTGQCSAVDLRLDSLSECTGDTDCRLRWGTGCCESCGGTDAQLVAYNKNKSLEAEVCDPLAGACPPCVPPEYPAGILAICIEGHCRTSPVGP